MPVDFFSVPCNNLNGNCQTEVVKCLQEISENNFGISDANANDRIPAVICLNIPDIWDFTIINPHNKIIRYKAIDYCVNIFRTGAYDVNNDHSAIDDFSSEEVDSEEKGLIKRCEGLLLKDGDWILFFEIKNRPKGDWLIDARRKFEETILSFKEHHPELSHLIIEPIVSNKAFFRVHQTEMIQKRILKDKIGVELKVQTFFEVN